MNKVIVLGITFLFIGMSFTSISGNHINNQIIRESGRGNILYVGGSGPGNYSTIQSAINDSSNGDTVFVYDDSSPYKENLNVRKSINLIAENKNTTIIFDSESGNVCIGIVSDYVTVKGFKITSQSMNRSGKGIYISASNFCNIIGNEIFGFSDGILIDFSRDIYIFDNNIYHNEDGLLLYPETKKVNISNNIISNNIRWGVLCYITDDIVIYYNTITNNEFGIDSSDGKNHIYKNNNISYNSYVGILSYTENVVIVGNLVSHNEGFGIDSKSSGLISNNLIFNNKEGGLSFLGDYHYILDNHIENNSGYGLISYSRESFIERNNLIHNQINAYFITYLLFFDLLLKIEPDIWDSNYYSDLGSKNSYVIHGKMSFFFLILFPWYTIDENPAKEPYDITTTQGCGIE